MSRGALAEVRRFLLFFWLDNGRIRIQDDQKFTEYTTLAIFGIAASLRCGFGFGRRKFCPPPERRSGTAGGRAGRRQPCSGKSAFQPPVHDRSPQVNTTFINTGVADPDPGSVAFLTLDPGWEKYQDPDPGSGSRMKNPDHICERLGTMFLGLKYLNSLMRIRDGKNLDPG